ncbi:MAG: ABC transporter substrate-binding protein, partial [Clostridiales Family XIII bacterium]|nr:ABC transporter substrate-binding protein [Clostridiales Family XIII bacterium]
MKKKISILISIFLVLSLMAACGNGGDSGDEGNAGGGEQTLVVHHWGDPLTFNPDTTGDDYNYVPAQNIFNRMVKLNFDAQIVPDLAQSWDVSEDGKTITFHLVEGAVWHDGEPFTSADVEYTFETLAQDESLVAHGFFTEITDVECPDDNTAVFKLSTPNTALIGYMGWYGSFVMPKHLFDNGQPWADNPASLEPIGTGPFMFEKFEAGSAIELVKNPDYWGGEPGVDRLVFKIIPDESTAAQALKTGEIDFMEITPYNEVPSLESEGFQSTLQTFPSPMYLVFNFRDGYETPLAVRQALALCVDREDINNKVFGGSRLPE